MIEQERPIGTLRPIVVSLRGREQRGHAYLPDPLPGRVDLEPATWEALADAAAALGELRGAVTEMPSLALVARPTIRREKRHDFHSFGSRRGAVSYTHLTLPTIYSV